ncbi:MAG TPA: GNAT family N-acetyltransferase, partial [Myxococcaceae bacterium]|nr:GNAT family N-acetyltransferase [Myxococcaceae bacterium]
VARPEDLPLLQALERAAGASFRSLGMHKIADDEPPTVGALAAFQRDGRAWVAVDLEDLPIAYLLAEPVDENAHIEQVSVHPKWARKGLGRALIDQAAAWAARQGLRALTLTTFAEVPWNAPYYERLGFQRLSEAEMTGGLRELRTGEAARGLDAWPRVTMRRPVP